MKRYICFGLILIIGLILLVPALASAQTIPPLDDNEHITREVVYANSNVVESILTGRSTVDNSVVVVTLNSSGAVTSIDTPTIDQLFNYLQSEQQDKAQTWLSNRTTELESCEADMNALVLLLEPAGGDFDALGPNTRDSVISGIASCIEVNSRVNRITINKLLEILVQDGITE